MGRRATTVEDLATAAGLDLDEALVAIWDAGIDKVLLPGDSVPTRDVARAQRALGVPTGREQTSVDYWLDLSGLNRDELITKLVDVGVSLSPTARKVPRNSVRKLKRLFGDAAPVTEEQEARAALPLLRWEIVGSVPAQTFLEQEAVCAIHEALVEDFRLSPDPIFPEGVRDPSLLSSALTRPLTGLGEERKYPTVEMAGAALLHSLVHNHPFHNGNKRTALVALLVFLDEHGMVLTCSEEEVFRFVLRTGQHSLVPIWADDLPNREVLEIARWIRSNSRRIEQGERPLKWLKLKQRLQEFGCECSPGRGNRLDIWRYRETSWRQRRRRRRLQIQVACAGDGTEAERNTIHDIRRQLELDDAHDIDSNTFYGGARIDVFIIQYRRILQRLGKF